MNFLKAKDYEKHAKVQDFMGLKLCEILKDLKISHFEKVFEFGCGRGELSKKLQNFITFNKYLKNMFGLALFIFLKNSWNVIGSC